MEFSAGDVWLLILQGVAHHVEQNSEALRHRFVNHEGKKTLWVIRNDFVPGSSDNDWAGVFADIVEQIDESCRPGVVTVMEPTFSTTTPLERVAGRIAIMDVCKKFFDYICLTLCGFPRITLFGTRTDWVQLHERISPLLALCEEKFAEKWREALFSVTTRFIEASLYMLSLSLSLCLAFILSSPLPCIPRTPRRRLTAMWTLTSGSRW